ncbi:MAG: adenylyl cyclase class-3/4/guanylyl cyclase [Gaiellaceae bacterium]|nr:adenylyl cyclase class-3/4/guanylyl cyclase [Gaiellaceae bacterium]
MKVCPSCGRENAHDARFCSWCATPLTAASEREERKVVTCLFCDLVGFTSRAERMDPEDVRGLLQPYHARLRSELERFGGTVEKFIGDAVMAVFGAPVAHEDDPERAVRAALSIRDALAEEGDLEVRIGITTGEALVALGARPEAGEGMASGDVVNTAARLQAAAATNAILVDETTFRATERSIEYGDVHAVEAKGKAEPIPVREALTARARVSVERVGGARLVGREAEVNLLRETFTRVLREREPQLVTLVGVPGIGKSRLVFELFQTIETGDHGLVYWRHGRSLPYGEGVTFWALGEIVKAQAGILESDGPRDAEEKLRQAVDRFVGDATDAAWIERRLRPLTGLDADDATGDHRDEAFAAWRRYLEAIADERPLVLVFEDLHWADDALLDFVDHLVDRASGVPLLVLCTARPELLTRRPGWGGGKVNSSTILLSPLSEEETARLLHALLGRSAIDADLQGRLLMHAGGNPLYAEEFTRMLLSRPSDVVLPETVQGIIAARLDTLPTQEKELLQEAAVVGRVFWLGALGRERWTLEERLHSLARKEFVTRSRRSSVAGEDEYVFRHALVRDVAYEQIPRAERAEKHREAAEWLESLGRIEDHAEMLAHHYASALDYARASGQNIEPLAERGRIVLREAGDRAFALNAFASAVRYYELAVGLWAEDAPERPELLLKLARTFLIMGDDRQEAGLEKARDAADRAQQLDLVAQAEALLAELWWYRGDREACDRHLDRAYASVRDHSPSPGKAHVLCQVSRYRMLADDHEEAIRIGEAAFAMSVELGLVEPQVEALVNIGTTRANLGDAAGLEDLERAVALAVAAGSSSVARAYNNLAVSVWALGDLRRGRRLMDETVLHADRLGLGSLLRFSRNVRNWLLAREGDWDEALPPIEDFIAACDAGEPHYHEGGMRLRRAVIRLGRDDVDGALDDLRKIVPLARGAGDPQQRVPWLSGCACLLVEMGYPEEARQLTEEVLAADRVTRWALVDIALVAEDFGYVDQLATVLERGIPTRWTDAATAIVRGDVVHAAEILHEIGDAELESTVRLRAARRLVAEGRGAEADEQVQQALAFYRSVDATRYIRQAEKLLGEVSEIPA